MSDPPDDPLALACEGAANVIDSVLTYLAPDLPRIPEPTRSMAVGLLRAAAENCRDALRKSRSTP